MNERELKALIRTLVEEAKYTYVEYSDESYKDMFQFIASQKDGINILKSLYTGQYKPGNTDLEKTINDAEQFVGVNLETLSKLINDPKDKGHIKTDILNAYTK